MSDLIRENPAKDPVKLLSYLFYLHIAGMVTSLLVNLPSFGELISSLSRLVLVAVIICLHNLAAVDRRYRKASNILGVGLILTLLQIMGLLTGLLASLAALANSVLSILACYYEYYAHADLIRQQDGKLADNWHRLFRWSILVGVLGALISVVLISLFSIFLQSPAVAATVCLWLVVGLSLVIDVFYLLFLHKTITYARIL